MCVQADLLCPLQRAAKDGRVLSVPQKPELRLLPGRKFSELIATPTGDLNNG